MSHGSVDMSARYRRAALARALDDIAAAHLIHDKRRRRVLIDELVKIAGIHVSHLVATMPTQLRSALPRSQPTDRFTDVMASDEVPPRREVARQFGQPATFTTQPADTVHATTFWSAEPTLKSRHRLSYREWSRRMSVPVVSELSTIRLI